MRASPTLTGPAGARLWQGYVVATTCLGLGSAVVIWGWSGPLAVSSAIGVMTVLVWCAFFGELAARQAWPAARCGLEVAAVVVGAAGLVAGFGWSGAALVAGGLGTCPRVHAWFHSRVGDAGPVDAQVPPPVEDGPSWPETAWPETAWPGTTWTGTGPASADDETLCRAWRRSFLLLQTTSQPEAVAAVAARRQQLLDELTRRHPVGVSRWLASGARAAGNPLPFLVDGEKSG